MNPLTDPAVLIQLATAAAVAAAVYGAGRVAATQLQRIYQLLAAAADLAREAKRASDTAMALTAEQTARLDTAIARLPKTRSKKTPQQ